VCNTESGLPHPERLPALAVHGAAGYACAMARPEPTRVRLRKPLERSIHGGHPWLYREAIDALHAEPGAVVDVLDKSGRFLARGLAESGPIGVRLFTTRNEAIDAEFFAHRIAAAFALRARVIPPDTNAYRLLHGEGDRLPGMVCDRYAELAVLKLDGAAAEAWRTVIADALREPLAALGVNALLVRTGRKHEQTVEQAWGQPTNAPPREIEVREHGIRLLVNPWQGQKTGLFLDHRESRRRVRAIAAGLRVLNLYGYTGGFSVAAGLGAAAHVTTVDSAAPALDLAQRSWAANELPLERHVARDADVPAFLAELGAQRERFGLVIADPPNFAPNAASKPAALESYAALHRAALGLLEPGGYYLAASCSSHVAREDFEATLREGARRARRVVTVLERAAAPADHPRLLAFPEGDYLKVDLMRVE
jgi:23S rRNA (cytosine1962-C5)-methyltransferase